MNPNLPLAPILLEHHYKKLEPYLHHWFVKGTLPHALLLTGPRGIGKLALTHWIAQTLFCEKTKTQTGGPIGPCLSCLACKKAQSGTWVDFHSIGPEPDESIIKVEAIRTVRESMGFSAFESKHRVFAIDQAEKLNVQASNSLLKTLEEPPEGRVFILNTSDPSLLLPTIVSRCQKINLAPLKVENVEKLLTSQESGDPDQASRMTWAAKHSGGSPGLAKEFVSDTFWEIREKTLGFLKNPDTNYGAFVEWIQSDPTRTEPMLAVMEMHLHETAPSLSPLKLGDLSNELRQARAKLGLPINRKLMVQGLAMQWLDLRH